MEQKKTNAMKDLTLKGMRAASKKMSGIDKDGRDFWGWPPTCSTIFHQPKRPDKK